ncbi:DedA family protein [Rhodobacterales bacterium HKCCE3408]|nr:DedA family protein [Rhodobacterales bacterium HKCCE3408]
MTGTILGLVAEYGALVVAVTAFLSCLLVPIPTSLAMLAAGGFVSTGDLDPLPVALLTWAAAVAGDQTGYWIGRTGGAALLDRLARGPKRAALLARAREAVDQHGGTGVFFSTWLVAPLGPYVNFAAGGAGLGWLRFTLWDAAGEAIWVGGYLALGYVFADRVEAVYAALGNFSGLLVAVLLAIGLGALIIHRVRQHPHPD